MATLTFPTEGTWTITWSSELDMAGSSAPLTVLAAGAAPVTAPTPVAPAQTPVDAVVLVIVALVLLVAIVGGGLGLRRRRAGTSVPAWDSPLSDPALDGARSDA